MKKFYFLFFIITYNFLPCQNLDWLYFSTLSSNITEGERIYNNVNSMAVDKDENVYIIGQYMINMGFDEDNPTNFQLISPNGYPIPDCFLVKLDKNKKYIWHKTIAVGSNSIASMFSLNIDKNGNIIVAGTARGNTINLNPDSTTPIFYNTSLNLQNAVFINKYTKDGDFIFGNFYLGASGTPKVITDDNNNIIVTGHYTNYNGYNTDFDLSSQNYYLNGKNGSSFLLKIDENGNFKAAKFIENVTRLNQQMDNNGNIIIFGNSGGYVNFNNQSTFSNSNSYYNSGEDFLLKLDSNLNAKWFQGFGGANFNAFYESQPFAIDSDNSIITTSFSIKETLHFPNQNVSINDTNVRSVIYKLDENGNYLWHSSLANSIFAQSQAPVSVTVSSDHTVNWSFNDYVRGVYLFHALNETTETIKIDLSPSYSSQSFGTLLKLNQNGKLIYNKQKIFKHSVSRFDSVHNKFYFLGSGKESTLDSNPDQNIKTPVVYNSNYKFGFFLQKLDKCYSGTPDGDPFFYTCVSEQKKIKDLYPKTSYSSWYDSPTSTTPLSPETVLETKKYYAMTQDVSCPQNPTRLEVDVRVFANPADLVVPDFTFCNIQGKRISDLNINNNQNVEFFDETMKEIYLSTLLEPNKKYYVRQKKQFIINYYYYDWICRSNLTSFFVYDTSVAPTANNNQVFCKIDNPKISDILVTGINLKWYDENGNVLNTDTVLENDTKYYVTQTSGTCESTKAEVLVKLNDPNPPTGNANQDFCPAQNPTLQNIQVSGTNIKWYDENENLLNPTASLINGKTYFATQTINNCESTQKLSVKVTITTNSLPANDYFETFCDNDTDDIMNINLDDFREKLISNFNDYIFEYYNSNNQPISNLVVINLGLNEFNVKITSSLGCYKWVKLSLILNPKPKLNLPSEIEICNGIETELDAGYGFTTYQWNTGSNAQIIKVTEEGIYTVTVANSFGCISIASIKVKKTQLGEISDIIIINNNVTIIMSNSGNYLFSLDNINWQISNEFKNLKNGNYTVYVKTNNGCVIGNRNFSIFSLSNIITPDADGKNDRWIISGIENYKNSEITIIDRNGSIILKTTTNGKFEWDGKISGRPLPTGTYWYHIKVSDGRILQGYIVLKNRN